jgi:hypothetical protein
VKLDGERVLSRYQRFYDSSEGACVLGGKGGAAAFSGNISAVVREPLSAARQRERLNSEPLSPDVGAPIDGVWRFVVRFPKGLEGTREPFVISGETGRGDLLAVEYLAGNHFRLLLDHWGSRGLFSPPIQYDPGHPYHVEISHAAYAGRSINGINGATDLVVKIDGRVVWRVAAMLYPVLPEDMFVGFDPIGGSGLTERFSGSIERER